MWLFLARALDWQGSGMFYNRWTFSADGVSEECNRLTNIIRKGIIIIGIRIFDDAFGGTGGYRTMYISDCSRACFHRGMTDQSKGIMRKGQNASSDLPLFEKEKVSACHRTGAGMTAREVYERLAISGKDILRTGLQGSEDSDKGWHSPLAERKEESAETSGEEVETQSNIIVKPDGSRVLVVTVNVGGMETTMSLELSKPTRMPNDESERQTETAMRSTEESEF